MSSAFRYVGQTAVYLVMAALIGYLSDSPSYTYFPPDRALIRLAFVSTGVHKGLCHELSAAERDKLAPNMRKAAECPRERLPVWVELVMDGAVLYRASLPPTGLASDGPSKVYQRFTVLPGPHHMVVRMRDSERTEGYDHEASGDVTLLPQQSFVIGFEKEFGGFQLGDGTAQSY